MDRVSAKFEPNGDRRVEISSYLTKLNHLASYNTILALLSQPIRSLIVQTLASSHLSLWTKNPATHRSPQWNRPHCCPVWVTIRQVQSPANTTLWAHRDSSLEFVCTAFSDSEQPSFVCRIRAESSKSPRTMEFDQGSIPMSRLTWNLVPGY